MNLENIKCPICTSHIKLRTKNSYNCIINKDHYFLLLDDNEKYKQETILIESSSSSDVCICQYYFDDKNNNFTLIFLEKSQKVYFKKIKINGILFDFQNEFKADNIPKRLENIRAFL